ncbi:MAG: hypothetical protein WC817_00630 [Patescibacteria group bacterium]
MPFIYAMIVPVVFLDIAVEIYQRVCFPLYGLPVLSRVNYIRLDRQKLSYLRPLEKFNCTYCGYVNGVFRFASAIAAETEKYWCGIMHKKYKGFLTPKYQEEFLPYGDKKSFERFLKD